MTALGVIVDRLRREGLLGTKPVHVPVPVPEAVLRLEITSIATDSRLVVPGTLFCAVRGSAADGHAYLDAARSAGAMAALVEVADSTVALPQIEVLDGRRASAFAAAEVFGNPWEGLTLVGVTGTNGKTTTVSILRHLLSMNGPAASIGTLGTIGPDGRPVEGSAGLTTPGPVQMAEEFRRLSDSGVKAVAMEVSSHALDQGRVAAMTFDGAIFTNLTRDHLDYHGSIESYRAAKLKLVDRVRTGGVLAVNADDPAWEGIDRPGVHLLRFGTRGRGEVQAEKIRYGSEGVEWDFFTPSCTAPVRVPLFGDYNVSNALGAATALWGLGWTAERIAEGLSSLPPVPGRLERVPGPGPKVLIDYAHTPDALERALQALRAQTDGRVIVVFGAGGDRDRGKRPEMGRVAAENADLSIVTSDNPRTEDPAAIAAEIEAGMGDAPRLRILDRREAIKRAIEVAGPADIVLLAGKGHETYQIWGDEYRPFDERQIVAAIRKASLN